MAQFDPDDLSRFQPFNILTTPYKTIYGQQINLDVLYPKSLVQSPARGSPVVIRFHGGGLVTGGSLFPGFFGPWLLELAERHSALIVSVDHRLLPEATIADVMEDVEDFWRWSQTDMVDFLRLQTNGHIIPDLSRIMTAGESAGGYLSIQLSLSHPDKIKATAAAYPMVDIAGPHFTQKYFKQIRELPQLPESLVSDHLAQVKAQETSLADGQKVVVSSDVRLARVRFMFAMIQNGLYRHYIDPADDGLVPLQRLGTGAKLPRGGVFIWHGADDSIVPVDGSRKFAAKVKEVDPELRFNLTVRPGEHGFDADTKIDEEWMRVGMAPLLHAWLDE